MQEATAKTKWCPFSRTHIHVMDNRRVMQNGTTLREIQVNTPVAVNKQSSNWLLDGTHCIGSNCMAWRVNSIDTTEGYCGLAGFQNHGGQG